MATIKTLAAILPLLAFAPAAAEVAQPVVSEETKIRALRRAYEINGNSMTGWTGNPDGVVRWIGSIDLTGEDLRPADPMPQHPASAAKIVPEPRRKSRLIARESPAQP
jgi:hypothetical protein